eukprot:TRINITY_DN5836_c0_g1_i1.p3 TRINITY_DN5836_c0_g1~~TRINITY_DN5836_c0_g1_i1.p3  ORF type:complete len:195 (-),score=9.48 TRINITY_DN5836_c0_g1_i1:783-1367(-)
MLNSVAVIAKAKAVANKWIMDEDKKLTLKLLQTIHTVKSLDNVEYCLYIFHQALLQEGIKTLFSPFHVTGTLNLYNSYLLSSTFCEAKSYQCRIPIKSDTITKICSDLKEKAKFASLLKKRLAYRFKVSESEIQVINLEKGSLIIGLIIIWQNINEFQYFMKSKGMDEKRAREKKVKRRVRRYKRNRSNRNQYQ